VKTLDRKLLRDLSGSGGLLLAITSIMAVGVTCFVSMQSTYHNLKGAKDRYYRQCRMADFWIELKKAPRAEFALLSEVQGIADFDARIQFFATVDLPRSVEPINSQVLSLPYHRDGLINDIVLRRGSYFTPRRQNEVIVNEAFAKHHRLHPGQTIHLLLNNRRQELFIVGTAISSEYTYLLGPGAIMPDPKRFGVFYIKEQFAEEVFDFEGAANSVVGTLAPAYRARPRRVLAQAERILEPFGVITSTPLALQPSNNFLTGDIDALASIASVMPTIFLAVAALVLNVLMTRLARQQRTVTGTLKALGYSNWQIFGHFLKFGSSVGIIGGIVGCVLGFFSATGLTGLYGEYYEFPDLRADHYPSVYLWGMLVSIGCSMLGSAYAARSMLVLQPAAAMRPEPPKSGGRVLIEFIPWFWNHLSSNWRMVLRSIFRHRFRTLAGVFASTMGAGLLVAGFMFYEAGNFLIDFQLSRVVRSDIDLALKETRGLDALLEVRRLPGVDLAEPQFNVACTFKHGPYQRKGSMTGIAKNARLTVPQTKSGEHIPLPEVGVVLTSKMAEILHARPGDQLTVEPVRGDRTPVNVRVTAVADSYLGLAVYADLGYLSRIRSEELAMNLIQLKVNPHEQTLNDLYRKLKQLPGVESINTRHVMVRNIKETLVRNQRGFIGFLIFFAGVVFFGSVVNGSLVNLAERRREVATLASLGYTRFEIGLTFLKESMLTNLAGTLLGMPFGAWLVWLMAVGFSTDLVRLPIVFRPWIFVTTLGTSIAFAIAAHALVHRSIARMDIVEALKVKE